VSILATAVLVHLLALTAAFAFPGQADTGHRGRQPLSHWSAEIVSPELSSFQRIVTGVRIQVDGPELVNHHTSIAVEFEDADGGFWRAQGALDRAPEYVQNAFVLPGDYTVSIQLYDPVSLRNGFMQKKVHVAPLKVDPLPGSWEGLPQVEFLPANAQIPDAWFLPSIASRMRLPVAAQRPVHIDLLVNLTPSERASDAIGELRRNMSAVIPALRVISQLDLRNGSMDVAFLDLTRRKITWEQRGIEGIESLNWTGPMAGLSQSNPGIVDVRALDGRWKMRGFFLDQVTSRLGVQEDETARVVIVLSGPAFLEDQEPAAKLDLPPDPARRVFYIRCRLIPRSVLMPRPTPRPGMRTRLPRPPNFQLPLDDLEQPFNGSGARIFDVITPEQFRRVLAAVIGQISRM
jgi:hypothetical protein